MKSKLIIAVTFAIVFAACGGDEKRSAAEQAQFETVQEGSAPGVTSTIHGPGETIPPLTATNVDTTSAFTLNPAAVPTSTDPMAGTVAGTFPDPTAMTPTTATGTYRPPVTRSTPVRTAPQPSRKTEPPPATETETAESTTVPPTSTMTSTQPPPPTQTTTNPPKREAEEDDEDAEQTDTAPPPPPPGR